MNLVKSHLGFSPHHSTTGLRPAITRAWDQLFESLSRPWVLTACLTGILLVLTIKLGAQSPSLPGRTDFKVGYFGNIQSNNGLNLGAEYLWKEKVKTKERRKGQKTTKYQLLLNGSLGYSTNFATQTQNGIFAYSGLILRRVNTKSRELFVELNPLGVYRSVLPATYEVVGDDVSTVSFPGRSYHAPSIAFGIGRFRKGVKRSGWYLNLQYTVLNNYNADSFHFLSLHFGRKFNFRKK